jgi:hypothetical protein
LSVERYRTTARLVGGLFLAATIAGLLAVAVAPSIADGEDALTTTANEGERAATAALLEVLMGIAVAAIAIVIYPVLRHAGERVAIGYVVSRSVEGVLSAVSAVAALTFLAFGRQVLEGASDAAIPALGDGLMAVRDAVNLAVLPMVFALSALLLNGALFQARLVPRWLTVWGLIGAVLYLAWGLLALYDLEELPVLAAPLGVQELAFALWLLVKGFNVPAVAEGTQPERGPHQSVRPSLPTAARGG